MHNTNAEKHSTVDQTEESVPLHINTHPQSTLRIKPDEHILRLSKIQTRFCFSIVLIACIFWIHASFLVDINAVWPIRVFLQVFTKTNGKTSSFEIAYVICALIFVLVYIIINLICLLMVLPDRYRSKLKCLNYSFCWQLHRSCGSTFYTSVLKFNLFRSRGRSKSVKIALFLFFAISILSRTSFYTPYLLALVMLPGLIGLLVSLMKSWRNPLYVYREYLIVNKFLLNFEDKTIEKNARMCFEINKFGLELFQLMIDNYDKNSSNSQARSESELAVKYQLLSNFLHLCQTKRVEFCHTHSF